MDHTTKRTVHSKAFEGVSYTVRVVSYGLRNRLTQKVREVLAATGLLGRDLENLPVGEVPALAKALPEIDRVYFDELFLGIKGLRVDGRSFDGLLEQQGEDRRKAMDAFLDEAPEGLVKEVQEAIQSDMVLTPEQEKNLLPPGAGASAPGGASVPLVN